MPGRSRKPVRVKSRETTLDASPLVVKGWTLFFHEHLLDELERLTADAALDEKRHTADVAMQRGTPAASVSFSVFAQM